MGRKQKHCTRLGSVARPPKGGHRWHRSPRPWPRPPAADLAGSRRWNLSQAFLRRECSTYTHISHTCRLPPPKFSGCHHRLGQIHTRRQSFPILCFYTGAQRDFVRKGTKVLKHPQKRETNFLFYLENSMCNDKIKSSVHYPGN